MPTVSRKWKPSEPIPVAMSSQQPPGRRLPRRSQSPSLTTILDLGDDLILRIFLHLPSLPALVRAALTCRAFLAAVRTTPVFRRRFRALHAPPLLGLFLDSSVTNVRSYAPLRRRSDPDFNAAVRASDFFITGFPDEIADAQVEWHVADCRGGYVLLLKWWSRRMAAYNPFTWALDLFPAPHDEIAAGHDDRLSRRLIYLGGHMLSCDESPGSFRVVTICRHESQLRAAIFSSGTREWQILPWIGGAPAQPWLVQQWHCTVPLVKGSLYWSHVKEGYSLVLNTATLQFSWMDMPDQLNGHTYRTGETKVGNLCIASAVEFTLFIWLRRADAYGAEKWVLDIVIQLEGEVLRALDCSWDDLDVPQVWAILNGIVHLLIKTSRGGPRWFLSFCLETRQLEKIFHKTFDNFVYPFIMAWPPSSWHGLLHW